MNDRHDTPPPDTHPAPPPSDDEPTSPGGHTPPPPPPNGDISGAPAWAVSLDRKLDELLSEHRALGANVTELVEQRRSELKRITDLERRFDDHEEAHAEAAYQGNGSA